MSGYNEYSDDPFENEDGQRGGGGLRRMLEESLAENKRLREAIEGEQREKSTSALLKEKGLDPAVAELIPEGQNAAEWVDKYARLLGVKETLEDAPVVTEPEVQVAPDDPAVVAQRESLAAEQQARAQMQDAAESGLSPSVQQGLIDQMNKIDSEEELLSFFGEHTVLEAD